MKTQILNTIILFSVLMISSCSDGTKSENSTSEQAETQVKQIVLDTILDKYIGCYKDVHGGSDSYSIGKIPDNAVVRYSDLLYFPLDKKYIGKYFLVKYCFGLDINRTTNEHGYCLPEHMHMGSILDGVDEQGNMYISNYSIGQKGIDFSSSGPYGTLVPNSDGGFKIIMNNATYVLASAN